MQSEPKTQKSLVVEVENGATGTRPGVLVPPDPDLLLGLSGPPAVGYTYEHEDGSHWTHSRTRLNRRGGCLVPGCRRPFALIATVKVA